MDKYRKFFGVVVICIFAVLFAKNIKDFKNTINIAINEKKENPISYKSIFDNVEIQFKESLSDRNKWVDLYGEYQKILGNSIIGNFEYVLDQYGIIHMVSEDEAEKNINNFISEIVKLKDICKSINTPLLYIQAPNRECVNENSAVTEFNVDNKVEDTLTNKLQKNTDVDVLDLRKMLNDSDRTFDLKDLFLHTDLHMQTDAEIWMAKKCVDYLALRFGFKIDNNKYLSDMSLYNKKIYPLLGSYGRTVGRKFTKIDSFTIYHPKEETNYTFTVPGDDSIYNVGTFDDIILNGYENTETDEYTYWVTDFGKFSRPIYRYTNNKSTGPKLLIICDSIAYRAISYMTLTCSEITILDPRFFEGEDYLKIALEDEYDAVLLWQGVYLMNIPYIVK